MGLVIAISICSHKKYTLARTFWGKLLRCTPRHSVLDQNRSGLKHFLGVNWVK